MTDNQSLIMYGRLSFSFFILENHQTIVLGFVLNDKKVTQCCFNTNDMLIKCQTV